MINTAEAERLEQAIFDPTLRKPGERLVFSYSARVRTMTDSDKLMAAVNVIASLSDRCSKQGFVMTEQEKKTYDAALKYVENTLGTAR